MIPSNLQYQIHLGDRAAFQTLFRSEAKAVYCRANEALHSEDSAKRVVKYVFTRVYRELRAASGPIDLDARIPALTDDACRDLAAGIPLSLPASAPAPAATQAPERPPLPRREHAETAEKPHKKRRDRSERSRNGWLVFIIVLVSLLLVWLVVGILMSMGILPTYDLGYGWFNSTIYPLFPIAGLSA